MILETNFLGKLDRKVIVALLVWKLFQERERDGTASFIENRKEKGEI